MSAWRRKRTKSMEEKGENVEVYLVANKKKELYAKNLL